MTKFLEILGIVKKVFDVVCRLIDYIVEVFKGE